MAFDFNCVEYDFVIESYNKCCLLNEEIEKAILQLSNLSSVCNSIDTALEQFQYFTNGIENLLFELFREGDKHRLKEEFSKSDRHYIFRNLIDNTFK